MCFVGDDQDKTQEKNKNNYLKDQRSSNNIKYFYTEDKNYINKLSEKSSKGSKKGRWDKYEHLRFMNACLRYGSKWKKVNNLKFLIKYSKKL